MFQRVLIKKYGGSAQSVNTNGKQRFTRVPLEKAALNVQKSKGEKMDNIHIFALTKAYWALREQLEKGDYEKNYTHCYYAIGTMLHWLLDVVERLYNDKSKYCEFRFINNQLKHNTSIVELHSISGGLYFVDEGFPFGVIDADEKTESSFVFPEYELVWKKIIVADLDKRYTTKSEYINQVNAYQNNLQNKNILESFTTVYESIMNEVKSSK